MKMNALFQFFKKYNPLSSEAETAISQICSTVIIKKNEELQPIGHTCKTIYFINKGIARIYYLKDGIDITESFASENNLVVRVESLFTGKPSKKAIQILEDARDYRHQCHCSYLNYTTSFMILKGHSARYLKLLMLIQSTE